MSESPLLGCPHCAKPLSFAAELAGRTVACPHCRGPFQMPLSVPAQRAASTSRKAPAREFGFEDEGVQTSAGSPRPPEFHADREPAYFQALEQFTIAFVYVVIVGVSFAALSFLILVVPDYFREAMFRTGVIAIVLSCFVTAMGILVPLLLRAWLLTVVDSARNLRAIRARMAVAPPESANTRNIEP
jgi:hypothetical protein